MILFTFVYSNLFIVYFINFKFHHIFNYLITNYFMCFLDFELIIHSKLDCFLDPDYC